MDVRCAGGMRVCLLMASAACAVGFSHPPATAGPRGIMMQIRGVDTAPGGGAATGLASLEEGGWLKRAASKHTKYMQEFRSRIEGGAADAMQPEQETNTLASVAVATAGMHGPERWAGVVRYAASHRNPEALEALINEPEIPVEEEESPVEKATAAVAVMALLSGFEHSVVTALSPELLCASIAQCAEFLAQGWAAYNAALVAGGGIGMIAKGVTSSTIMGVGDIIGQRLFPPAQAVGTGEEADEVGSLGLAASLPFLRTADKEPLEEAAVAAFDAKRTGDFALVGAIIATPTDQWYAFLGRVDFATLLPGVPSLVGKVLMDQLMWAPFCLASVFGMLSGLQGDGLAGWKEKMRTTWGKTVLSNWVLWVPAQMLNFLVIPPQLQLLYANVVGLGWNVYLSKVSQGGGGEGEAAREGA